MASSDNANSNYEAHDEEEERRPLMVQVTAPASLPEGYTFEALLNDDPHRTFTCEVVSMICTSVLILEFLDV